MKLSEAIRQAFTERGLKHMQGKYFSEVWQAEDPGCCVVGALLVAQHDEFEQALEWYIGCSMPYGAAEPVTEHLSEGPFEITWPAYFQGQRFTRLYELLDALVVANDGHDCESLTWQAIADDLEAGGN